MTMTDAGTGRAGLTWQQVGDSQNVGTAPPTRD
jgi:hypothetical protein